MTGVVAISRHWDVPHGRDGGVYGNSGNNGNLNDTNAAAESFGF